MVVRPGAALVEVHRREAGIEPAPRAIQQVAGEPVVILRRRTVTGHQLSAARAVVVQLRHEVPGELVLHAREPVPVFRHLELRIDDAQRDAGAADAAALVEAAAERRIWREGRAQRVDDRYAVLRRAERLRELRRVESLVAEHGVVDPVVGLAEARADDPLSARRWIPRDAEPRGEVVPVRVVQLVDRADTRGRDLLLPRAARPENDPVVRDLVLAGVSEVVVTDAQVQGEVRQRLPVVLEEQRPFVRDVFAVGIRRLPVGRIDRAVLAERLVVDEIEDVLEAVGRPLPVMQCCAIASEPEFAARPERVRAPVQREDVLDLPVVLREVDRMPELRAEARDVAAGADVGRFVVRSLSRTVLAYVAERGLVQRLVGDHPRVREVQQLVLERVRVVELRPDVEELGLDVRQVVGRLDAILPLSEHLIEPQVVLITVARAVVRDADRSHVSDAIRCGAPDVGTWQRGAEVLELVDGVRRRRKQPEQLRGDGVGPRRVHVVDELLRLDDRVERVAGQLAHDLGREEEERVVAADRPADAAAEIVAVEVHFRQVAILEESPRAQVFVPVELEDASRCRRSCRLW